MLSLPIASSSTISFPPKPHISIPKSSFNGVRIQHRCTIRVPPQAASFRNPASSVVMMAKREEEMKEIRTKTTEEINEEVVELKGELLMLRLEKSARNEFKSSEFGRMRKRVLSLLVRF
jgi:large subunit ribosomal protein L29